jgi:hypothetical protein
MKRDVESYLKKNKNAKPVKVFGAIKGNSEYGDIITLDMVDDFMNEEIVIESTVEDNFNIIRRVANDKKTGYVGFGGKSLKVEEPTAKALVRIYDGLSKSNQNRVREKLLNDEKGYDKLVKFAWKHNK